MEKISAIITSFNREDEIEECLRSVSWVDELIVVDSFSTDRTVELAEKYADLLLHHEYLSAAAQRNWTIPQASHPWIMIIDSDEMMPEELRDEIKKEMEAPRYQRYRVWRKGIFLGREMKYGGWQRDQNNILFKKDIYRFSDDEVHPILLPESEYGIFDNKLIHFTHRTIDEFVEKAIKYATWSSQKYLRQGRKGNPVNILSHPVFNFVKNYLFHLGFMDGAHGLISAVMSSCYVAEKHAKLWELVRKEEKFTAETQRTQRKTEEII